MDQVTLARPVEIHSWALVCDHQALVCDHRCPLAIDSWALVCDHQSLVCDHRCSLAIDSWPLGCDPRPLGSDLWPLEIDWRALEIDRQALVSEAPLGRAPVGAIAGETVAVVSLVVRVPASVWQTYCSRVVARTSPRWTGRHRRSRSRRE